MKNIKDEFLKKKKSHAIFDVMLKEPIYSKIKNY